jgi:hypothetical protein
MLKRTFGFDAKQANDISMRIAGAMQPRQPRQPQHILRRFGPKVMELR